MLLSNNKQVETQITNAPFIPEMFVIKKIRKETVDTFTLELVSDDKNTNFPSYFF